jgi:hypothetical protein
MKIFKICVVSVGLLYSSAFAQSTVQFVWHGNSNLYQASFQLTDAEMQPGVPMGSSVFFNSLTVTSSLTGLTYNYDPHYDHVSGGVNPWSFAVTLYNLTIGTQVSMYGGEPPVGAMAGGFTEHPFQPGPDFFYSEGGSFTYAAVPEPSSTELCSLVLVLCFYRETRREIGASFSRRSLIRRGG